MTTRPNYNPRLFFYCYRLMLSLFPRSFRDNFAEEMEWVAVQVMNDAAEEGAMAQVGAALREITTLPAKAAAQWIKQLRARQAPQAAAWDGPPTGKEFVLVSSIFALPALVLCLQGSLVDISRPGTYLLGGLFLGLLLAGLARGLPRWSLPVLGLALSTLSFLLLYNRTADMLSPTALAQLGITPRSSSEWLLFQSLWAGMMWLGLFAVTALTLGLLALVKRFRPLLRRISQDWTLASYILYSGALALITLSFAQHQSLKVFALGSMFCLAAGAWLYLYSPSPWQRTLTLVTGLTLALAAAAFGQWPLMPMHIWPAWENWPAPENIPWFDTRAVIVQWLWMAAILMAPALFKRVAKAPPETGPAA